MKEVRLYGHLARRFGRRHRYAVRTPAEAVRALCATLPGFRAHLAGHSHPGYRVLVDDTPRALDELGLPAEGVIKIVPVTAGAGRGLGQVILGAVLIGVGVLTGGASMTLAAAWAAGGTAFAGYLAANVGMALALGGVSQMLAPQPKAMGGPADRPDNKPSYAFDGPVNTTAQGHPVPVCYGRLIVGSQVISAGLAAEEMAL
ncbi:MAG: tail assembly protein [Rhodocyclaceae bacterium]|nr:tail assembly protein [Rhodocyclaceae bacterium]